jgi:hypothetical protein
MAFGDYATLLSSFAGSDEAPLSEGGNWSNTDDTGEPSHPQLEVVSHQVTNNQVNPQFFERDAAWLPEQFGPDAEIYMTVADLDNSSGTAPINPPGTGPDNQHDLGLRFSFGSGTSFGYRLGIGGRLRGSATWQFQKAIGTTSIDVAAAFRVVNPGDKVGFRIRGFRLDAWIDQGSGWELVLAARDPDETYFGAGYAVFGCGSNATKLDDVYAGTIPRSGAYIISPGSPLKPTV